MASKNCYNDELLSTLMKAVSANNLTDVQRILELGGDINGLCDFENDHISALSLACKRGHIDMAKYLVQKGADISLPGNDGKTALHYTCEGDGWREVDSFNQVETSENGLEILEFLINSKANVNRKDNMGRTPLFTACEADDVHMVKLLVQRNCDVNSNTVDGDSPVMVACRNAKFCTYRRGDISHLDNRSPIQITKVLLQAHADVSNATLLPTVVQYGNVDLITDFLDLGMDINMLDDNQCTPLGAACSSVNVRYEIVQLLLEKGADVNKGGGWKKQKPLIFAYVHNSVEKIILLLSYGAALTPEEMTELVSLSFSKSILENPEVIGPQSKELLSWRLLLAAGFKPQTQGSPLTFKMQQLSICSSYGKISPWIQTMVSPLRSLKEMCRINIRHCILPNIDAKIPELGLPKTLNDFLTFKEFSELDSKSQ